MKKIKKTLLAKKVVTVMVFLFIWTLTSLTVMADKKEQKGYLGVSVSKMARLDRRQLEVEFGVLVTKVEKDSAADKGGILEDDVIQYFKGEKITDTKSLVEAVRSVKPGEKVNMKIKRNGKNKGITVKIGEYKSKDYSMFIPKSRLKSKDLLKTFPRGTRKFDKFLTIKEKGYLGVNLHEMDESLAAYFGVKKAGGALILSVEEKSPADKSGLRSGDVILAIDKKVIGNNQDVVKAVSEHKPGDQVDVKIMRHKKKKTIKIKLGKSKGFYGFKMSGGKSGHFGKFDMDMPHFEMKRGHFGTDHFIWNFKSLQNKLKNIKIHIDENLETKLKRVKEKLKKELKQPKKIIIKYKYI